MVALRWRLKHWLRQLGWTGIAGVALCVLAAAVYFAGIAPARSKIAELQREALSVRAFSRGAAEERKAAASGHSAWLDQFYRLLPAKSTAPEWLRIIFASARTQSLGLEQGDYKVSLDRNGRLLAYEIKLPVRGSYVQVRRFVADVLERIPAIALDEIVIKRDGIGQNRVDASIRFTLFLNAF
jgi:Tfp pilus assembly protein PilO